jgi:hypothetical protein
LEKEENLPFLPQKEDPKTKELSSPWSAFTWGSLMYFKKLG